MPPSLDCGLGVLLPLLSPLLPPGGVGIAGVRLTALADSDGSRLAVKKRGEGALGLSTAAARGLGHAKEAEK